MTALTTFEEYRTALLRRQEIALLDVSEEGVFATAHPLFAASMPLSRLELDALVRIPRLDTRIVVYDHGEGLASLALHRLERLGYSDLSLLDAGLDGWREAGGEIFIDVNAPSKAFGELVDHHRHTPSLPAEDVGKLIANGADIVVLDSRPFGEYTVMNIPTGTNVPGGELVYRVREMARSPNTTVIVNCAGRTRSIIGAQSLVNAGIPNQVYALRNGTIGWLLAGQELEKGQTRIAPLVDAANATKAAADARAVADRAKVGRLTQDGLNRFAAERDRTLYRFDVRTPEEYEAGHRAGFRWAPGGQLVQETDVYAPVRNARIVLADTDGTRANMTASWLAQMGWEVYVLDDAPGAIETGVFQPTLPPLPEVTEITAAELAASRADFVVVDLASSQVFGRGHIPGAWFAIRSLFADAAATLPGDGELVLTSPDGLLARLAAPELAQLSGRPVRVLSGGTVSWTRTGYQLEAGTDRLASPVIDRYRRPYEGTDNRAEAMQAYLDWEYGLVDQLGRDGTHGFFVI